MPKKVITPRNQENSKLCLIKAVETKLRTKDLNNLGVNAIAEEAKRDKVLIYKYFQSLEGLYEAFLEHYNIIPSLNDFNNKSFDEETLKYKPGEILWSMFEFYLEKIRKSPLAIMVITLESLPFIKFAEVSRKKRYQEFEFFDKIFSKVDPRMELNVDSYKGIFHNTLIWFCLNAQSKADETKSEICDTEYWQIILRRSFNLIGKC